MKPQPHCFDGLTLSGDTAERRIRHVLFLRRDFFSANNFLPAAHPKMAGFEVGQPEAAARWQVVSEDEIAA
jgi:hypothetical protein